jgi:hypothetical protein
VSKVAGAYGQNRVPNTDTKKIGISDSHGVYIGTIKKNDDPQKMGRVQVYIEAFGGKPEDEGNWIPCSYASPFGGATSIFEQGANAEEYADTMKSYGFWATPPDIDNRVLVAFADGKLETGYWFACLFQRNTQVSIPGLPAGNTHKGDNRPVAPKNKRDKDSDLEKYVEHTPAYTALKVQGLDEDPLRGTTSSGAMRESPSRVMGILTPGQHQFVMDDGDKDGKNRLIRLRTVGGTQILIDDVAGHIYMISKAGESWVEISADGQVHVYGSGDINIRSEANINLRADKNVNIEAGQQINIAAGDSANINATTEITTLAGTDTKITSAQSSNISSGIAHYETAGVIHMNGPTAAAATAIPQNTLPVNQNVKDSICTTVPEHEPWAGHAGSINPVGPGNQQMKKDPAPDQTPRQPKEGEQGAPLDQSKQQKAEEVDVNAAKTSDAGVNVIKEENGFTPVNVKDADGQSVGFGSELPTNDSIGQATQSSNPSSGVGENIDEGGFLSETVIDGKLDPDTNNVTAATTDETSKDSAMLSPQMGQGANKSLLMQANNQTGQNLDAVKDEGSDFVNKLNQDITLQNANNSLPILPSSSLNQAGLGNIGPALAGGLGIGAATSGLKGSLPNVIPGQNIIPDNVSSVLSQGVTPDRANQMLLNDVSQNENSVKGMLSGAGVQKLPQNSFDSLVSFHNQTGDASYAFVKGEKIDLTGLYQKGEWDRAASFMAADERDRSRRIKEASMMSYNNYGSPASEQSIVNQGLNKTDELIGKGMLNQQTGSSATWQQTVAAGTSYFNQTGKLMPSLNSVTNLNVLNNVSSGSVLNSLKRQAGPWPY